VKPRRWDVVRAEAMYVEGTLLRKIAAEVGAPSVTAIRAAASRLKWLRKVKPEREPKGYTSPRSKKLVNLRCYRCLGHYEGRAGSVHGCRSRAWHSIYVPKAGAA
jgi:hypothetical protein